MNKYNFIVYQNETGFIQQITNTPAPNLPMIPEEDGVTAIHVNFYNPEIVDRYFVEGKFYEDAELTIEITDPANFTIPYIPPEPSEPEPGEQLYTLDEACEIITQEVASDEV